MDQAEPNADAPDLATSFSFLADTRSCLGSPELRRSLRTTRTWVLTLAVLACCWLGLMSLYLLGSFIFISGLREQEIWLIILFLIVLSGILGLPVAMMFQFASRVKRFISTASLSDFVAVLQAQRWMWNVLGIYGILAIVVNLLALAMMSLRFFP